MKNTDLLLFLLSFINYSIGVYGQNQPPIFEKTLYVAEIVEEQTIGSSIIRLKATIIDDGVLTFRLDPVVTLFSIDQATGLISVAGRLDREASDTRRFNAYAKNTKNGLESQVQVVVHLTDINDNDPNFANLPATVKLRENIDVGTIVYTVAATDVDTSRNALLRYSIAEGNEKATFAIDLYSGKFSTRSKLDFEKVKDYNITLKVQDSGENTTRSNTSVLRIIVLDHDDQPGKFLQAKYFATIQENSPKRSIVTNVKAIDMDLAINAPVYYGIEQDSNPGYIFAVGNITGTITVNGSIDRETSPMIVLRVSATSTMFNPDYTTVFISVSDVNDNRPAFLQSRYDIAIAENTKTGTILLKVTAEDKDAGINSEVGYSVVGGDAKFKVSTNGSVTLADRVDREQQSRYNFVVVAAETKTSELYDASVPVYVNIIDINDNEPKFEDSNYTIYVKENVPLGTSVLKVKATDKDSGDNALISYIMNPNSSSALDIFNINSGTGEIRTLKLLDREKIPLFTFQVIARNSRSKPALSSTAIVNVIVEDVNDNSPVFSQPQYFASVIEHSPMNTTVFNMKAFDADTGLNALLNYELLSGDSTKFYINQTSGEVKTKMELDREVKDAYDLLIRAEDRKGKNSTAQLVVRVLDINDNYPIFSLPVYQFYVMEEVNDALVGQVKASDRDYGRNSNLTYSIIKGHEWFRIDSGTGVIKSKVAFDFEKHRDYQLHVSVSDDGIPEKKSSNGNVSITILDSNDHKPVFGSRFYKYNVTENRLIKNIGYVKATDNDSGINGALHYQILSGNENGEFALNSTTSSLSIIKTLDREKESLYVLIVRVKDQNGGKAALEDLAAVQVTVEDENDNSPSFSKHSLSVTINENSPAGSFASSFEATDNDSGANGQIQYNITKGNTNQRFYIDQASGRISIQSIIDRDPPNNEKYFELSIEAFDKGKPSKSSIVKLFVTVIDANDNAPTFSQEKHFVSIYENVTIGTNVFTPNCTDIDSGENGLITYKLIQGADKGFAVNAVSGSVSTTQLFDYDKGSKKLELVLQASDSGIPPLTSTKKYTVNILNVNDNWPWFQAAGPFGILEGDYRRKRYKIVQIKAFDNDSDSSSSAFGELSYSFVNMSSYSYDFYWSFKEISTGSTIRDSKSNASAVLNGARLIQDAVMGQVVLISGYPQSVFMGDFKDDCISNPTLCVHGLTVSMWIKFEAGGFIMSSGAQSSQATGISFDLNSGFFRLRLTTENREYEIKRISIPNSWFYFTLTWSKTNGIAYFENGMLKSKSNAAKVIQRSNDTYTKLVLGCPNDLSGLPQDYGRLYVGEMVIWRARLEEYEVYHAFSNSERKTGVPMVQPSTYFDFFEINKNSGEIYAVGDIDREKKASYSLDVKVSDADPLQPKSNYTQVVINVLDVNDNSPMFSNSTFYIQLQENSMYLTEVVKLTALDPDKGPNGQVKYHINFGNTNNAFLIDKVTGQIKTNGIIDREKISLYTLHVSCSDGGNPPRKSTAVVRIEILDANDEFPVFSQSEYVATIKENLPEGQSVLKLIAVDRDLGSNGLVNYNLSSEFFSIGFNDGVIVTKKVLDREMVSQHRLTVTASDQGIPQKLSSVSVIINVADVNDNVPKFSKMQYNAVVSENRKVGSSVIIITAFDPDSGDNGKLIYSMAGDEGKFKIDSNTGLIRTAMAIDREQHPNGFILKITASDKGIPQLSSSSVLLVNISDVNDNAPVFDKFSYRGSVIENEIDVVAIVVNATDADRGLAGEISYSITRGNSDGAFKIDDKGRLMTAKKLDREFKSAYELTIRATDKAGDPKFSESEVDIQIIDVNDNQPIIGNLPIEILISEETLVGSHVLTVTASDADIGINHKFSFYGISPDDKFTIDTMTGAVYTAKKFDFETQTRHMFYVGAYDHGSPQMNSTIVTINFTIADSNDNNPVFSPSTYFVNIKENAQLETSVVKVNASEKDRSAKIEYYISNGNHENKFIINNSTGLITVNGLLDREKKSVYFLLLTASDNDVPPRLGQAYVTVTVTDVNDLPPRFTFRDYKTEVTENAANGILVLQMSVNDPDSVNQTKLTYKILDGNVGNAFAVTFSKSSMETASLTTSGIIDRETIPFYYLKVSVSDGIHTDVVNVTIKVKDENDNLPIFNSSLYKASVYENTAAGHSVIRIFATDKDEGSNSVIKYSFAAKNSKFLMNEISGEITTSESGLDREEKDSYGMLCKAEDSGGRAGFAYLLINVKDRNDERPVFVTPAYGSEITEGPQSKDSIIAIVKSTDKDIGVNSNVTYNIKHGNIGDSFTIDRLTGVVTGAKNVDREEPGIKYDELGRGIFELLIEATDQGNPSLSSANLTKITIVVQDINDNAPRFLSHGFSVFISEGALANQNVTVTKAFDRDAGENGTIKYQIIAGNNDGDFKINTNSGMIATAKALERQKKFSYNLTILASDQGSPPLASQTTVHITVGDTNDNIPVFSKRNYFVNFFENVAGRGELLNLTARDGDKGQNAVITYSIIAGNEGGKFSIETKRNHGTIFLDNSLDREAQSGYSLVIMAKDGGIPFSRMAFAHVTVQVTDENDNPPVLTQLSYSATIKENLPPGTLVPLNTPIYATDLDIGINAKISYSLSGNESSMFTIDEKTGMIRTSPSENQTLDYEVKKKYKFVVSAINKVLPKLQSTASIEIELSDINDNSPIFSRAYYNAEIKESAAVSSEVLRLNASDLDSGLFGRVSYFIVSGSEGIFSIDKNSGVLRTQRPLDRESKAYYQLNVSAVDGGFFPNIGYCTVGINIIDVNDNTPRFERLNYDITVSESTEIGSNIAIITARDIDQGIAGVVTYSMMSDAFNIGAKLGYVNTTNVLDRETKSKFDLTVTATDGHGLYSNVTLIIRVGDVNDNAPIFLNPNPLIIDVFEMSPVESIVGIVTAYDKDIGDNGIVEYSISSNGTNLFKIDTNTGVIRLNTSLDYASLHRQGVISPGQGLQVNVKAMDKGKPRLSTRMNMTVNIIDINEENPYFDSSIFYATIKENQPNGSFVIQVQARKKSVLSKLTYSFVTENVFFKISKDSGNITTANVLDRENIEKHILNVKVNDNEIPPRFGYTTVLITILDENDNPPKFENTNMKMQIREDAAIGTFIGTIKSTDADTGNNGLVYFKIVQADIGEKGEMVPLDNICIDRLGMESQIIKTSQISSSSTLIERNRDYSPSQARLNSVRYLQAGIEYQGAWCSGVTDINQYLQVDFGLKKIIAKIATQGIPQGSDYVSSYRIIYSDDGQNWGNDSKIYRGNIDSMSIATQDIIPEIRARFIRIVPLEWKNRICLRVEFYGCNIDGVNIVRVPFHLDAKQGTISISEPIDRERKVVYKLQIQVYDLGTPSLNTTATLEIKLLDVNDNAPKFSSAFYEAVIPENSVPGQQVFVVFSNDSDVGKNSRIRYSLVGSSSKFIIEATSGIVRVAGTIDYERKDQRQFILSIKATDGGSPALSSISKLLINVTDVNDNAPIFNQSEYSILIPENMRVGSIFTTVVAHDADQNENAKVTYSLTGGQHFFLVDNKTGEIQVTSDIDREKIKKFNLIVIAEDNGVPKLQSSAKMIITVEDKNDNTPKFTRKEYRTTISEKTNLGSIIMVVKATDLDFGSNSKINYSIMHSNESELLRMNSSTGEIFLVKHLDRERKSSLMFEVIAEDHGSPRLSDMAKVVFIISDENDNSPYFDPDVMNVVIREDASAGSFMIRVNASDKDTGSNAALTYSLVHGSDGKFSIEKDTGIIRIAKYLDRESKNYYSLIIMASDKSTAPLLGFATVKVTISDVNDNKPNFTNLDRPFYVMENMPYGTSIGQITVSDKDIGENAYVKFSIAEGKSSQLFQIDLKTGLITTTKPLDREADEYHKITVVANNTNAENPLTSNRTFVIQVLDTNDNAPYITQKSLIGGLSEASKIGTPIMKIVGKDSDMGTNAKLIYNIRYDLSDGNADFIAINSKSGYLVTRLSILDRELRNVTVFVEVSDYGIPYPLNSTREIFIQITDVNDNGPEFSSKIFRADIGEDAPVGSSFVSVYAIDRDTRANSEMIYSILSGNERGHFEMNETTGVVTVHERLDRETMPIYHLNVSARNKMEIYGNNDKFITDTTIMEIQLKDVNDNQPYFTRTFFTGGVPANAQIGTYVMDIKAADADVGTNAAILYDIVSGNQQNSFRIDPVKGRIFSARTFVGMSGARYEISVSAKDNNGKLPFNLANNATTARIYVLKESQRLWLVLDIDAKEIEANREEFIEGLSNITQSKVYLESLIKILKNDGSSRSEIVFHAVNENLGIIMEGSDIRKNMEQNKEQYKSVFTKWKINQVSEVSAIKTGDNKELKTYVIPLIVIGILLAMFATFAIFMLFRLKRKEASKNVYADDLVPGKAKHFPKKNKRTKRFSEDHANWANQYEDWWKINGQKDSSRISQDSLSQNDVNPTDTYLYESKINLLKQGMLGKRNRSIEDERTSKQKSDKMLDRTVDNPIALESLAKEKRKREDGINFKMVEDIEPAVMEGSKEITSL